MSPHSMGRAQHLGGDLKLPYFVMKRLSTALFLWLSFNPWLLKKDFIGRV